MKEEWELVTENAHHATHRLKVPGGWLYRTMAGLIRVDLNGHEKWEISALTTTFVPDTRPPDSIRLDEHINDCEKC